MKRLSKEERAQAKARGVVIFRRARRASKRIAKKNNRGGNGAPPPVTKTVIAPEEFHLITIKTRARVLGFLADLRTAFLTSDTEVVKIDFSNTKKFVAGATVMMYAEIARLREWAGGRVRVRCINPRADRPKQVLQQIGLLAECGIAPTRATTLHDVVHWRVAHGCLVDNSICAPAIEPYEGHIATPLVDGFFRGLGEAMTNAIHHAYIDTREDGLAYFPQQKKDWWMFSQAKDGELTVVFCDLGVGIPRTLPQKQPSIFKRLINSGLGASDSACIAEAIADSKTRTKLAGRGRGLGNIVDVVSRIEGGVVAIFSNRGCYTYMNGKSFTHDFKDSILGTVIYWKVPIAREDLHGANSD